MLVVCICQDISTLCVLRKTNADEGALIANAANRLDLFFVRDWADVAASEPMPWATKHSGGRRVFDRLRARDVLMAGLSRHRRCAEMVAGPGAREWLGMRRGRRLIAPHPSASA